MESYQEMKSAIDSILKTNNLLDTFKRSSFFLACLKSKKWNGSLEITKRSRSVTVGIYVPGDANAADPWMEFRPVGQEWHPYSLESGSGEYTAVEFERSSGEIIQIPDVRLSLIEISGLWARYLLQQDFSSCKFYHSRED